MRSWALWLSFAAFVTVLARGFLDWAYVLPEFSNMNDVAAVAMSMVGYLAFFALWLWALIAAVQGARRGLVAVLVFNVLAAIGWGLATALFLCPTPCRTVPPVSDIIIWANVFVGAAAAVAVFRELR